MTISRALALWTKETGDRRSIDFGVFFVVVFHFQKNIDFQNYIDEQNCVCIQWLIVDVGHIDRPP